MPLHVAEAWKLLLCPHGQWESLSDLRASASGHIVLRGPLCHVVAHLGRRVVDIHIPEDSRHLVLAWLGKRDHLAWRQLTLGCQLLQACMTLRYSAALENSHPSLEGVATLTAVSSACLISTSYYVLGACPWYSTGDSVEKKSHEAVCMWA